MTKDLIGQQLENYRLVSLFERGGFPEIQMETPISGASICIAVFRLQAI